LKNASQAEEAKNIILTKYPDTDYAKLILDPDYYKKLANAAKDNEQQYEELHRVYRSKQWYSTVQLADDLLEQTNNVTLIAKTSYLKAVALGQIQGKDTLVFALNHIIKNYPKEPVTELAKILLSTISDIPNSFQEEDMIMAIQEPTVKIADSTFNRNLNEMHYIIVLVDVHKKSVSDVKYDISTFNSTYFSLERFNINSFYINQDEQLVTVSRFKGKTDAMNYYIAMTTNDVYQPSIQDKSITVFAISASNYSIYYNKPEARHLYKSFFEENYK
jgi:hypothetical protein